MRGREAFESRRALVELRVVFHRAGAERIHPVINSVVPRRNPREMADDVNLADFGQSREVVVAQQFRIDQRINRRRFDIERGQFVTNTTRARTLEDQTFVLIDVNACFFDHCCSSKNPGIKNGTYGTYETYVTCESHKSHTSYKSHS